MIVFAAEPVDGFYTDDRFQVLPVPAEAPRPPVEMAEHPFLLEFIYPTASDWFQNFAQRTETMLRLVRAVNVLLNVAIHPSDIFTRHAWVPDFSDKQAIVSHWEQLGYWCNDLAEREEFSATNGMKPMPRIPASAYQAQERGVRGEPLNLPDDIDTLLSRIRHLDKKRSEMFLRSATWLSMAESIYLLSRSSAYTGLVSAIETLMPKGGEKCPACGQTKYQIGRRFEEFMRQYSPGGIGGAGPQAKAFYKLRSQIGHGLDLDRADLSPLNRDDPRQQEQEELHRSLYRLTRRTILNWLLDQPLETEEHFWV